MPGAVFLRGDDVTLRTIEEDDIEFLRDAINHPEVREGLTTAFPLNAEQEREYFEDHISDREDVTLAICHDGEAQRASERSSSAEQNSADSRVARDEGPSDHASGQGREQTAGPRDDGDEPRDGEIAGTIGLHDLNQRAGHCEIGIWLAPEFHGRGYGTEASRLLTDYAFRELRMHRVMARVLATNEASARIWEKLGFENEGVHRDEVFTDGKYVDMRYFGVLADEWLEKE